MHGRFLILVWACCLPLMLTVTAAEEHQGEGCSAKCGKITVSAPFWLTDLQTGKSCGSPGPPDFEVTCYNSSYPLLPSSVPNGYGFAIINISYEERSMRLVDVGKMELFRDIFNKCLPFWNTSVKLGRPFRIDPINLYLIFYNCTEEAAMAAAARRDRELLQTTTMRCMNTGNAFFRAGVRYDATGNYAGYALEGCDAIVVPMVGSPSSSGQAASDYEQLIKHGFLSTWDEPLFPFPAHPARSRGSNPVLGVVLYGVMGGKIGEFFSEQDNAHLNPPVALASDRLPQWVSASEEATSTIVRRDCGEDSSRQTARAQQRGWGFAPLLR
uniref:Wall-associated receptor kinase galacturonan-binding domain-containing protein n=1 Tax=Triticum aestivum TaxID=4565 RepID=A0A077RUS1_WHEAT|nr:unnamed protein product [Triticum aestivum]